MGGSIPPIAAMSKKKKTKIVYSSDIGKPVQGVKFNNRKKDKKK